MIWLLFVVYLIDALSYPATQAALMYACPIMCMAMRMLMGGSILSALVLKYYPEQWRTFYQTWYQHRWAWLKIITVYVYVTYLTFFLSMRLTASSTVALLYNLTPLVIAFLGYFLTDQRMTGKKWLALALGFFGLIPMTIAGSWHFLTVPGLAELLMLISVFAMSYGWFLVGDFMQLGYSPLLINGIGMSGAAVLAFVTSLAVENNFQDRLPGFLTLFDTYHGTQWPGIVYLMGYLLFSVIAVEIIFYNATAWFMQYYSIVFISFIGMITPVMVASLSWLFLREALPAHFVPSFLLLCASFILFYQEELALSFSAKKK